MKSIIKRISIMMFLLMSLNANAQKWYDGLERISEEDASRLSFESEIKSYIKQSGLSGDNLNKALDIFLNQHNPKKLLELAKDLSKAGYSIGDYWIGWCYEGGEGVNFNPELGVNYFKKAANAKIPFPFAFRSLGYAYGNGNGVTKNLATALNWYIKGAESIDADIYKGDCYRCAAILMNIGEGVAKNSKKAYEFLLKSVQIYPDPRCMYNLGVMKLKGEGTTFNEREGWEWINKAAKLDHPEAQYVYGVYLIEMLKNKNEGKKWLMQSARNGNTNAILYLEHIK